MANFKIFETNEYISNISEIDRSVKKIKLKLESYIYPQLRENPFYGKNIKKLRDYSPDTWRYRVGTYRLFYEIDNTTRLVSMTAADTRADSYK